jgi:hypothetical protein
MKLSRAMWYIPMVLRLVPDALDLINLSRRSFVNCSQPSVPSGSNSAGRVPAFQSGTPGSRLRIEDLALDFWGKAGTPPGLSLGICNGVV